MKQQTVTINGVIYDQRTGKPLRHERGSVRHHNASQVHATTQHSTTLNRKYLTKPTVKKAEAPAQQASQPSAPQPAPASVHKIAKFAPHPTESPAPRARVISDIGPTRHALTQKVAARQNATRQAARPVTTKPAHILKREAIADATARTVMTSQKKEVIQQTRKQRIGKSLSIASAALGFLLLGGYLTYLSMPNISTRVAAAQAGINANYPSYKPSGYSLAGPVAYQQGAVSMKFAANGTPVAYTLTQARSGWDSSAVLDNYIMPKAGNSYTTTTANGLMIYTFENNAAWVNGGILYTISGNAPLSNEQIQRIATSV